MPPKASGAKAAKKPTSKSAARAPAIKRTYFKQVDFPLFSLQDAQRVATALVDDFGAREGTPPDIALSIGSSPTSSVWRDLAGASAAYGLIDGGPQANVMKLLPLGKRLSAPEEEDDDILARREAVLKPRLMQEFFEKYRRAKFPSDLIAMNVLRTMGIPSERVAVALEILKNNGRYAGIVRDTPTGLFVSLDAPIVPGPVRIETPKADDLLDAEASVEQSPVSFDATPQVAILSRPVTESAGNRVFITHGKQRSVVNQIKELLTFGSFDPVVSVERESTAIPVPEKVFEDMRSCAAGVIHVGSEGKYLDRDGAEHTKINDNVLIEIGAAIALYGKKVILLVEKGVSLPSNLQGLYRCEFDGDKLDYDSTMKLLKTFSQFR